MFWKEIAFVPLSSTPNIYTLHSFTEPRPRVSVSVSDGKFTSIEFDVGEESVNLKVSEQRFAPSSSDVKVISMDGFYKSPDKIVFAVCLFKENEEGQFYHLNIYEIDHNFTASAGVIQSIQLPFVPYLTFHCRIGYDQIRTCEDLVRGGFDESVQEIALIVSGDDERLHSFTQDDSVWGEKDIEKVFPVLSSLQGLVICFHMHCPIGTLNHCLAVGYKNMNVEVIFYNCKTFEITTRHVFQHDSILSSVRLFALSTQRSSELKSEDLNLLVTSTLEASIVYRKIYSCGFRDSLKLVCSDQFDLILSSAIFDMDMDGENEIAIGTFGGRILFYKVGSVTNKRLPLPMSPVPNTCLLFMHPMPGPVYAIRSLDITRDGLNELVVIAGKGLHILQHDLNDVARLIKRRIVEKLE